MKARLGHGDQRRRGHAKRRISKNRPLRSFVQGPGRENVRRQHRGRPPISHAPLCALQKSLSLPSGRALKHFPCTRGPTGRRPGAGWRPLWGGYGAGPKVPGAQVPPGRSRLGGTPKRPARLAGPTGPRPLGVLHGCVPHGALGDCRHPYGGLYWTPSQRPYRGSDAPWVICGVHQAN